MENPRVLKMLESNHYGLPSTLTKLANSTMTGSEKASRESNTVSVAISEKGSGTLQLTTRQLSPMRTIYWMTSFEQWTRTMMAE